MFVAHTICDTCAVSSRHAEAKKCNFCNRFIPTAKLELQRIFLTNTLPPPSVSLRQTQHRKEQRKLEYNRLKTEAAAMYQEVQDIRKELQEARAMMRETFGRYQAHAPGSAKRKADSS
ncbi:hypothetical protein FRC07_012426 [Ceratobasidium sp. 392]|nr:hypothetical protein FRC07_012426 [Ceratobasidium sp. 392]